ncbi:MULTISPECIES: hypothetical protein [unclassified Microbacterium]|uniref:hypothetical protein n=1 Tax=unclassified Microbacterium TaxID=2609290 RepID=UPI0030186C4A
MSADLSPDGADDLDAPQRIVRVRGARRARLTPVPGTDASPERPVPTTDAPADAPRGVTEASGPNDERLRRDVPPHY